MDGLAAMVELVLVFAVVMGIAVWQLVSVKREIRRDRERGDGEGSSPKD